MQKIPTAFYFKSQKRNIAFSLCQSWRFFKKPLRKKKLSQRDI
jgi:hypothetical protein